MPWGGLCILNRCCQTSTDNVHYSTTTLFSKRLDSLDTFFWRALDVMRTLTKPGRICRLWGVCLAILAAFIQRYSHAFTLQDKHHKHVDTSRHKTSGLKSLFLNPSCIQPSLKKRACLWTKEAVSMLLSDDPKTYWHIQINSPRLKYVHSRVWRKK